MSQILALGGAVELGARSDPGFDLGDLVVRQRRLIQRHPLAVRRALQLVHQQAVRRFAGHDGRTTFATASQAREGDQVQSAAGTTPAAVAVQTLVHQQRGHVGGKAGGGGGELSGTLPAASIFFSGGSDTPSNSSSA